MTSINTNQSMLETAEHIAAGRSSAREVTEVYLERIKETEPGIKAIITLDEQGAEQAADELDRLGPSPERPLHGVPFLLKDILVTKGLRTTCGSRILENFIPFYESTAVKRLRASGAVILGKTNLDEFAMGSSTENSSFGPTFNPWDRKRVPGGSSGGSAAAVCAGQCAASLGTDTGGSIRQPAAFCGVVGLKPTYGLVSRFGLIAYGSSLDQIGPITSTVADAAAVLGVIAGHDPRDSTSVNHPVPDYLRAIRGCSEDLSGLRVGVPAEYWGDGPDREVSEKCAEALQGMKALGAKEVEISLPHTEYAVAAYYILAMAEASSNLARFDGVRFGYRDKSAPELKKMYELSRSMGFGDEVKRRIMIGTHALSSGYYDAYYKKAAQMRRLIREDFIRAFEHCDVICAPVAPTTAFRLGENTSDPLQMYLTDIYTNSLNLTGLPGLSLPVGLGRDSGMPVGMQIFSPAFSEELLLCTGHILEKNLPALPEPADLFSAE
ncbi:MAG: Asp-tRNA(Asn)/Glu-tRNA(Gln) amidotransferase subunit GatA [Desulfonatronovibrionaceae bacterium]